MNYACAHFDLNKPFNVLGPSAISDQSDCVFARKGTLADWQEHVAPLARYSSTLRLTTAIALTAPLLGLCSREPFLLSLTGPTSSGKTTAELFAGSVVGRATTKALHNWHLSEARLAELARHHNDSLLLLDDLATLSGTDTARAAALRDIINWMTGTGHRGRQKRASEQQSGVPNPHSAVRTIILTSYERPISDFAQAAKGGFEPGAHVRLLDVPILDEGSIGIVDTFRQEVDAATFAAKVVRLVRIRAARYHGTLYPAWIQVLVEDPGRARLAIENYMNEFIRTAEIDACNTAQVRHAEHFALMYAALAYAIKRELIPWSLKKSREAILKRFRASHARLVGAHRAGADGMRRLAEVLAEGARFAAWPPTGHPVPTAGIDGWSRTVGTRRTLTVIGQAFRGWFATPSQARAVIDQLITAGVLNSSTTSDIRVKHPMKSKIRCYVLDLDKLT